MFAVGRIRVLFLSAVAALAAGPSLSQTVPARPAGAPVHWTVDERLYHGNALLAPRFACNTHLSALAPKDRTGGACVLIELGCNIKIAAACARLAPYKPDFHNIEAAARRTSLQDMSTYAALHRPVPITAPTLSPVRTGSRISAGLDPNTRLDPKVVGGAPLQ